MFKNTYFEEHLPTAAFGVFYYNISDLHSFYILWKHQETMSNIGKHRVIRKTLVSDVSKGYKKVNLVWIEMGDFELIFAQKQQLEVFYKKGALKNFEEYLFYRTPPGDCLSQGINYFLLTLFRFNSVSVNNTLLKYWLDKR